MYKNKADALAYSRKYYRENHEKALEAGRKWAKNNNEKVKITKKAYYDKNNKEILEKRRVWKKNNPDKMKNYSLKQNFGISLEDYKSLSEKQNHLCLICKLPTKTLVVDHNHETGKIRGLLCHLCNCGIGHFKENINSLENAINYLKQYANPT